MRLTRAAEYAIRCMVFLAQQGEGVLTSKQEISSRSDIPTHFLSKIAQELAKAGYIEIRQGSRGGFVLVKDSKSITLLDVVETMIGEIYLNDCVSEHASCRFNENCSVNKVWITATKQLRDTLKGVSLAELAEKGSCME